MSKKPVSKIYYKLFNFALFFPTHIASGINYFYHFDKKQYRNKPVIVIGDHASQKLSRNMYAGVTFKNVNAVLSYLRSRQNTIYRILSKLMNCITVKQISNDPEPIKEMLTILKKNGSLFLLPEGRFSYDGSCNPVKRSLAKLLKTAGVDVIICNSYGAYLQNPFYAETTRKGKQEYHYCPLFSAEDLKGMSVDEIYNKLMDKLRYNDYEWNRNAQNSYYSGNRNAEGLENLLYYCPKCGSEFKLKGCGNDFVCTDCGNSVQISDQYELSASDEKTVLPYQDISAWYLDQRNRVRDAVRNPDFRISYECEMWTMDENKKLLAYQRQSEGVLVLDHRGITYTPKEENGNGFFVGANELMSFFADTEGGIQKNFMFYREQYVDFRPISEKNKIIKYMLVAEELRNIHHQDWI